MLKNMRLAMFFIVVWIAAFYSWIIIFQDHDQLRLLGATIFPIIGGTVSFLWVYTAYRSKKGSQRMYKLLLTIGMLMYVLSNVFWFVYQIVLGHDEYPDTVHIVWLSAYVFFFGAMIYKYRILNAVHGNRTYFLNLYIFAIVAFSASLYYIIQPIHAISKDSLFIATINFSYTVIDLLILYIALNIYFVSRHTAESKLLFTIFIGFSIQVIADIFYTYLISIGQYEPGSLIDPLWILSILIVGLSGFYGKNIKEIDMLTPHEGMKNDDGLLLNGSVLILTLIIIRENKWGWNFLVIGLVTTIILMIIRQVFIMRRNRELVNKLLDQAYRDSLTGLMNRASFHRDVERILDDAKEMKDEVALFVIDLDRFKNVNDTYGHLVGDYLLRDCAKLLESSIDTKDKLYRTGGDEFVMILPQTSQEGRKKTAERVLKILENPIKIKNYEIAITPSIGVSTFPKDGVSSEQLLKAADISMYLAKTESRNAIQYYNSKLHESVTRRIYIENELKKAIQLNQFMIHYQPKVDLLTRKPVGMEALLRWHHPELGFISPGEFIPIAEETGQIYEIGEWTLRTACKQNKQWHDEGLEPLCVSVNVSVKQLQHSNLRQIVSRILSEVDVDPTFLELEITESVMQNTTETLQALSGLKELGIKLSIDDFGTGYSSLHLLNKLPITAIKIDKSFVDGIADAKDLALMNSIIEMCRRLDLEIVIEGIEQEEQVERLENRQHIIGQGYLFGKPMPAAEFKRNVLST